MGSPGGVQEAAASASAVAVAVGEEREAEAEVDKDALPIEQNISVRTHCKETIFKFQSSMQRDALHEKLSLIPAETEVLALADKLADEPKLDYTRFKQLLRTTSTNDDTDTKAGASSSSSGSGKPTGIRKYLSAKTFLLLPKDETGCIKTADLLKFVQKSVDVEEVGLNLFRHCICEDDDLDEPAAGGGWGVHGVSGSTGFISEAELERYIFELIPSIISCADFEINFHPFYAYAASRCFNFYLDPHHTHRIAIDKLAHSSLMEEFVKQRRGSTLRDFLLYSLSILVIFM